jgi:hypothetical protein
LVTTAVDNCQFYEHDVFDDWASRTGLTDIEEQLVTRFLERDRSTLEEALDALDRVGFDITWAAVHGMLYVACRAQ